MRLFYLHISIYIDTYCITVVRSPAHTRFYYFIVAFNSFYSVSMRLLLLCVCFHFPSFVLVFVSCVFFFINFILFHLKCRHTCYLHLSMRFKSEFLISEKNQKFYRLAPKLIELELEIEMI